MARGSQPPSELPQAALMDGPSRSPRLQSERKGAETLHQDRARRTLDSLLTAGEALFAEQGYNDVGPLEIAQRAGVSVGSFYRYFVDKRELYREVARRQARAIFDRIAANADVSLVMGRTPAQALRAGLDYFFDELQRSGPVLGRLVQLGSHDDQFRDVLRSLEVQAVRRIQVLLTLMRTNTDVEASAVATWCLLREAAMQLSCVQGEPLVAADRLREGVIAYAERALLAYN